jgi:two-component system heavy metal sensor histidine kinase CusS
MSSKSAPDAPAGGRPWSLAARLTAWYAGSAFALVLVTTGFLYWALVQNLDREDEQALRDPVRTLRAVLRNGPGDPAAVRREAEWVWAARPSGLLHVRILDEAGATVAETTGMAALLPPGVFPPPAAADAEPAGEVEHRAAGKPFRLVAARAAAGSYVGHHFILQAALDQSPEEELLSEYRRNLAIALGLALVACALGGYRIARRGVRPLREITAAAGRVRPATLNERIALAGLPAELHELARTFNGMLDRLEESFARLGRFSADIAHELRTPLNNLRGGVEVALGKPRPPEEYRDALGSALEECDRLARMIDGLLFLARAENAATQIHREPLDLGPELEAVREFYDAAAAEAGVRLEVRAAGPVSARLDRALLQRAVGNLVANALAHTPAGGTVTLSAAVDADGVCVEVADTGAGITAEHLPFLFDRFYRVDRARTSAAGNLGLGLAIVKGIVELHGGRIAVASEPGRGTRLTLVFPMSATPAG